MMFNRGRFPAAGGPEQNQQFSGPALKVNCDQGAHRHGAGAVFPTDALKPEQRLVFFQLNPSALTPFLAI